MTRPLVLGLMLRVCCYLSLMGVTCLASWSCAGHAMHNGQASADSHAAAEGLAFEEQGGNGPTEEAPDSFAPPPVVLEETATTVECFRELDDARLPPKERKVLTDVPSYHRGSRLIWGEWTRLRSFAAKCEVEHNCDVPELRRVRAEAGIALVVHLFADVRWGRRVEESSARLREVMPRVVDALAQAVLHTNTNQELGEFLYFGGVFSEILCNDSRALSLYIQVKTRVVSPAFTSLATRAVEDLQVEQKP